jgi:uncharacterized lipoprotein YddW (UPF0748 family)
VRLKHFWLLILLGFGVAIALLDPFYHPAIAQSVSENIPVPRTELRGVWLTNVDSDVLFSRDNLDKATRRLRRLNFNTLYPTIWNEGYTLYPSLVAEEIVGQKVLPEPGLQNRDMLAEILELGHDQGFTVIPWFEFGLMAPADSELARRHSDWLTQRRDGTQIDQQGIHPRVWLNPLRPEVQQLIVDLISEVVANYPIDGIQLDDHFGLPVDFGYDDYTIQLYQQEHQGQSPPDNSLDPEWVRWRASYMTRLMVKVFFAIKNQNQDCIVSLAPNPRLFSYLRYLQDWFSWERLGFVEELIIQVYRSNIELFQFELNRPELQLVRGRIPVGIGILTGLKNRPVEMPLIQQQVQMVRDRQLDGVAFFFYESLGDRDDDFQFLFPTSADRPYFQKANPS